MNKKLYYPLIILALTLLAYYTVIYYGYVWDDLYLFVQSDSLRSPSSIISAVTQPVLPGSSYFRPLVFLTFLTEFQLFGISPAHSHSVNLLFHLLNVWLVYILARRYVSSERAIIAGLFYALSPTLIEPVSWVSGRFDLMVTTFGLLSLCSIVYLTGVKRILFTTLFFFLAALSKEMAVMLPILLGVHVWLLDREESFGAFIKKTLYKDWRLYLSLFIAGVVYLILRAYFLSDMVPQKGAIVNSINSTTLHIAYIGKTIIFYFQMAIWPFGDISAFHPAKLEQYTSTDVIQGYLACLITIGFIFMALSKLTKTKAFILCFIISLFPVLNILPLTIGNNIGQERFLAFPLVFIAIGLSTFKLPDTLNLSDSMRKLLKYGLPIILVLWSMLSFITIRSTSQLWDPFTFVLGVEL